MVLRDVDRFCEGWIHFFELCDWSCIMAIGWNLHLVLLRYLEDTNMGYSRSWFFLNWLTGISVSWSVFGLVISYMDVL